MLEKFYEIRVYRVYRGLRGASDERLLETRKIYTEPTEEDISNAIIDNRGDNAEVVTRYMFAKEKEV